MTCVRPANSQGDADDSADSFKDRLHKHHQSTNEISQMSDIINWAHNQGENIRRVVKIIRQSPALGSDAEKCLEIRQNQAIGRGTGPESAISAVDSCIDSTKKLIRNTHRTFALSAAKAERNRKYLVRIQIPQNCHPNIGYALDNHYKPLFCIRIPKSTYLGVAERSLRNLLKIRHILLKKQNQAPSSSRPGFPRLSQETRHNYRFTLSSDLFSTVTIRLPALSRLSPILNSLEVIENCPSSESAFSDGIILTRPISSEIHATAPTHATNEEVSHEESIQELATYPNPNYEHPLPDSSYIEADFRNALEILDLSMERCQSCLGIFFLDFVREITPGLARKITTLGLERLVARAKVCSSCFYHLKKAKIPHLYCTEAMMFPEIPTEVLGLNELEAALVAPRVPFMKLRSEINPGKQFSIVGNVHNIEINLGDSICKIIELTDRHANFFIQMKRKWEFTRAYMSGFIDIRAIYRALVFLLDTDLYINENVSVDLEQLERFIQDLGPRCMNGHISTEREVWANINYTGTQIVPAEFGRYRDLIVDRNGEWLTFPKIYCGKEMNYGALTYKKQCLSEFRRFDGRCRNSINKIFYSYMKLISSLIQASINYYFFQNTQSSQFTARQARNPQCIQQAIDRSDVDAVLRGVPTSPKFWSDRKRELVSMIRQIGPPSFFITLSPEEKKDDALITFLQLHNGYFAYNLGNTEREELIAKDPIMVATYTSRKFARTIQKRILSPTGVFHRNPVIDYFIRVEFQKRGSPHIHMLVWCDQIDCSLDTDNMMIYHAQRYISVAKPPEFILKHEDKEINIRTQFHKHLPNCKLNPTDRSERCKKSFPKPIMPYTIVLDSERAKQNLQLNYENFKRILEYHEDIPLSESVDVDDVYTYDRLLTDLNLTDDTYLDAIASSLKTRTVFLERKASSIFMNNYNENIIADHQANMDIQLITDPHALAEYVTSYMMKDQYDAVENLEKIIEETQDCRLNPRRQLEIVKQKFQNITKVSAQECAFTLLGLNFVKSSREFAIVNTDQSINRKLILKKKETLMSMNPDSTDIFKTEIHQYYSIRPEKYACLCLADFATGIRINLEYKRREHDEVLGPDIVRLNNECVVHYKRCNRRILVATQSNISRYPDKNLSQTLKLFMPWRNERDQTEGQCNQELYKSYMDVIAYNEMLFKHSLQEDFDVALVNAEEKSRYFHEKIPSQRTPGNLNEEELEEHQGFQVDPVERFLYTAQGDIRNDATPLHPFAILDNTEAMILYDSLNIDQKNYLDLFESLMRRSIAFHHVVAGGAGTGKSFLIKAIVQKVFEITRTMYQHVLLTAATGKAAFNIGGITLHTAFGIPLHCQGLAPLSEASLLKFQKDLTHVKLLIIDEISLVGERMLCNVNLRLQQIFVNNHPFGGLNVICVGDFYQLRPVKDNWVFTQSTNLSTSQWVIFRWFKLEEIMRQRGDLVWAEILKKLAQSHFYALTTFEEQLLHSRIFHKRDIPTPAIHLCYSNADVDRINREKIMLSEGEKYISHAYDRISTISNDVSQNQNILQTLRRNNNYMETGMLPSTITFKEGVKYMITRNIDVRDGLVNGAVGICRKIVMSDNEDRISFPLVKRVYLEFTNEAVGRLSGVSESNIVQSRLDGVVGQNYVAINCDRITLQHTYRGKLWRIKRIQTPLIECEALTIHKSQGQTYSAIALNISKPLDRRLLYVALSRVPTLSGVYLYGGRWLVPPRISNLSEEEKAEKIYNDQSMDPYWIEMQRVTASQSWIVIQNPN